MNGKSVCALALVLAIGGVIGYGAGTFLGKSGDGVAATPESGHRQKKRIDDQGESASVRALRARIRELERQLAERADATGGTNGTEMAAVPPPAGERREGFQERMERLQRDDPARYAQITNNMAQWHRRQSERRAKQMEILSSVDASRMSPAAQQVHADLQEAIARREELEQQLQDPALSDERRHELWNQVRELGQATWQLNVRERNNLITETAKELGFKGQAVRDFNATMREIIEATDNSSNWHGGHGRHRGPGGGPRGGGHGSR